MNIYTNNDTVKTETIDKKVSELTIEDIEILYYTEKIITLFKFITDDNYFIKLEKEA